MKWSKEKIRFVIIRTIGNFLFLFSLWGMAMTFGPAFYLEIIYRTNVARNIRYRVNFIPPTPSPKRAEIILPLPTSEPTITPFPTEIPTLTPTIPPTLFGQLTGGDKVEPISPVSSDFGIIIPKIGANAPIIPNVEAGNEDLYLNALKQGVAHAAGTVFPGEPGNIYLFAHSTDSFWNVGRYNAIFYLVKELEKGDEISVFFLGKRHAYQVVDRLIVEPSDVQYITEQLPYEQLTLQTCWPPGTTLKRLLILARPESDISESLSLN